MVLSMPVGFYLRNLSRINAMKRESVCMEHTSSEILSSSSFPVIHKVGNVDIFLFAKIENMTDREIHQLKFKVP